MERSRLPLNALRAFEATARHLNVTRAALELRVTQAAVSHHIKLLEEQLGVPLFRRLPRGMALTDEGAALRGRALRIDPQDGSGEPDVRDTVLCHRRELAGDLYLVAWDFNFPDNFGFYELHVIMRRGDLPPTPPPTEVP